MGRPTTNTGVCGDQPADKSLINRRPIRSRGTPVRSLYLAPTRNRRQDPMLASRNDGHKTNVWEQILFCPWLVKTGAYAQCHIIRFILYRAETGGYVVGNRRSKRRRILP
jgi:hypothetical protein